MYNFIVSQINPTCDTYVLQSLQGHSRGTQFLIFNLNAFSVSEFLISCGKMSPKKELIPYHILLSLLFVYLRNCFLVNFSCNFVPRKLHLKEVGQGRVELCMFL